MMDVQVSNIYYNGDPVISRVCRHTTTLTTSASLPIDGDVHRPLFTDQAVRYQKYSILAV